jgi:uncharacterized protein (DUF885 family)
MNGDATTADYAWAAAGDNKKRLDAAEAELKRLRGLTDVMAKLLRTIASITRRGLSSGCVEQRALTEQMHELSGSIKAHLQAEAALARKLKELRDRDPKEAMRDALAGIEDLT